MGRLSWVIQLGCVIRKVFISGKGGSREPQRLEGAVVLALEREGGPPLNSTVELQQLGKTQSGFSPKSLLEECSPVGTLIVAQ